MDHVDFQLSRGLREQQSENLRKIRCQKARVLAWWMAQGLFGEVATAHSPTVLMRRSRYSRYKRTIHAIP